MLKSTEGMTKVTITYEDGNVAEHYIASDLEGFLEGLKEIKNWVEYEVEAPQGGGYCQLNDHPQNYSPASQS